MKQIEEDIYTGKKVWAPFPTKISEAKPSRETITEKKKSETIQTVALLFPSCIFNPLLALYLASV
jgi:hypothetical protein